MQSMKAVKNIVSNDTEIIKTIETTGRSFETLWELLDAESVRGLRYVLKDEIATAAYIKKMMFAVIRAYTAGFYDGADNIKKQER